jgi:hypothetical protein
MTSSQKYALLRDLARLVVKYPPEIWRELIRDVQDGELVGFLESVQARVSADKPERKRSDPLAELRKKDRNLAETLWALRDKLRRRELMPGANDLREFANVAGLKTPLPMKRDSAIAALVSWLATLPAARVASLVLEIKPYQRGHKDDFDRWARLILGKPQSE